MTVRGVARAWFAATAVVVAVALVMQLAVAASSPGIVFPNPVARTANVLAFFTIQSNIIVGITTGLLAHRPDRDSWWFRTFRLDGLICILVTFAVYHTVLAGLADLTGWAKTADVLLHTVVPAMCVLGWAAFGPRGRLIGTVVLGSVLYPLAWLAVTLIRGAITDWYPYPFLEAPRLGYPKVVLNSLLIAAVFLALAAVAWGVDVLVARHKGPTRHSHTTMGTSSRT